LLRILRVLRIVFLAEFAVLEDLHADHAAGHQSLLRPDIHRHTVLEGCRSRAAPVGRNSESLDIPGQKALLELFKRGLVREDDQDLLPLPSDLQPTWNWFSAAQPIWVPSGVNTPPRPKLPPVKMMPH